MDTANSTAANGPVTISAEHRATLRKEALDALTGATVDLDMLLGQDRPAEAQDYAREVGTLTALLDQLGWTPPDREVPLDLTVTPALLDLLADKRDGLRSTITMHADAARAARSGDPGSMFEGGSREDSAAEWSSYVDRDLDTLAAIEHVLSEVS